MEIEVLSKEQSLELLASHSVGRIGFVDGIHPTVLPVNYAFDGEGVVFRTDLGTKLFASRRQPVAFEVDEIDTVARTGWSVHVHGVADEIVIGEQDEVFEKIRRLAFVPWGAGTVLHWVRILPIEITGRRIRKGASNE
jgi:nitroimidazol reductase NimA-like FMN-containing flavoprotein (pyridoxamine 5'-phosphate oxidase superfamily)